MTRQQFSIEQLTCIVQKHSMKLDVTFQNELVTSRSNYFNGSQSTFAGFINSLKGNSTYDQMCGIITVDLTQPAVDQIWDEVKVIMDIGSC